MSFWNFWKKNSDEANESLLVCAKSLDNFRSNIHKGHFQNFKDFKLDFLNESSILRKEIIDCKDHQLKFLLIEHFQKQLDYFNDNTYGPYAAKVDLDKFNTFIEKNYPYQEKVNEVKNNYLLSCNDNTKNEKFLTQGFSRLIEIIEEKNNTSALFNSKPRMRL